MGGIRGGQMGGVARLGGYGGGYGGRLGGYGLGGVGLSPWAPYAWDTNYGYWDYGWSPPALGYGPVAELGWLLGGSDPFEYSNPYFEVPDPATLPAPLNYSSPIPLSTRVDEAAPSGDVAKPDQAALERAARDFTEASAAFREGDYAKAQDLVERAIKTVPDDPTLHQFRALAQFARGRYAEATATVYAVLAAGPGWDWKTLIGFYAAPETYTRQLRALEESVRQNPDAGDLHFLLAYHYLTVGSKEGAIRQLREAVRLTPGDKLSPRLLETLLKDKQGAIPAPPAPGER